MKPGISSYTFTWAVGVPGSLPEYPLTARGLIDKAFNYGLEVLQIADNLPLEKMAINETAEIRQYAQSKGVSLEMGGRGLDTEHTAECLETALHLGSPILRMVIDSAGYQPDLNRVISVIRELLPEFRKRNIRLAIENHDRFKAREFEKIITSVGSEMVGICLDSVNSLGAGEGFETVSEILLPYTINLHLKDFTIFRVSHKMGLVIEGRPAGKGMLNIPELVARAGESGICASAVLELWTPPGKNIDETLSKESQWADESIVYLRKIIK